jgi:hypothetical protein
MRLSGKQGLKILRVKDGTEPTRRECLKKLVLRKGNPLSLQMSNFKK